jgi:hypothetical protein
MSRILPALYVAVFFVGFLWPAYINPNNQVVASIFLGKCEKMWWPVRHEHRALACGFRRAALGFSPTRLAPRSLTCRVL